MGERIWTPEQQAAIDTRDRTLLVSAAAGSGKTATLTERIIRSLTDEEHPVDIDSLLVVTFTNAAARELREKLARALTEAVAKNPENKRLERQLFMLGAAKIRTIDSFCSEILRSFSERVGVPPGFRIADVAECELLATSIAGGLIEAVYNGELPEIAGPEEFARLSDCLTDSGRSDELSEIFRYLREKCDSSEIGVDSLRELIEIYNPEKFTTAENTVYGRYIMERVFDMARHYIAAGKCYESDFLRGDAGEVKFYDMLASDLLILQELSSAKSYSELRARIRGFEFMRQPTVRGGKTPRMESYVILRKDMRQDVKELAEYFTYTDEELGALYSELYSLLSVLYRFLAEFDSRFLEEKRRRGALSYADIERYAYECLISNGKPTDVAESLSARYSAIYIDEYQDVNSLQNAIFEAISRPDNRFMVGDIKQSIYGFREACPEIFASMKAALPKLSDSKRGGGATVFMSNNFRCDEGIVDFVNSVFDRAFGLLGSSIGYETGDRLVYSKVEKCRPEYRKPEIYMLKKAEKNEDGEDINPTSPDTVAEKISEILATERLNDGRSVSPSDVAIILRSAAGKAHLYADALTRRGIPVKISGAKDFFLSSEVLLTLALLNAIDNPSRDIYLASVMCSPLFGFSLDELYRIRHGSTAESLYEALTDYCALHPDYSRGTDFLSRLAYYRAISEGVGADVLISKLYRETGLLALAAKSGGKDNLMLLYDYSRSYEAGAFRGLYNFISFINNILDKKTTFDERRESDSQDAVSIVTAHASKGLEYPIVIFAEASSRFSNRDKGNRLVYSPGFGIALRTRTPSGLALVNNPVVDIINHRVYEKMYEEELRVLYVALTRARERLYIYGSSPVEKTEEYLDSLNEKRLHLSQYSLRQLSSNLEVILTLSGANPIIPCEKEVAPTEAPLAAEEAPTEAPDAHPLDTERMTREYSARFAFRYPDTHLEDIPEKMSVSRTSPTVLDGSDGEDFFATEKKYRAPAFIEGRAAEESAKRGIATHYVLQFCELELLHKNGAEWELKRLLDNGFITRRDAERVRISEIEKFRNSSLFADMLGAKNIYRELRFNQKMPTELFTEDKERRRALAGETILVQGVIDCIVEYPDGSLGLFDYKTDRLSKEELENELLAEKKLRESHRNQLVFYAEAVKRIFGKEPSRVEVYSLALGRTVSMI